MAKKKGKPKSPEQILEERNARRRQDFEAVGLDPGMAGLPANDPVEVRREDQKHKTSVRRADVFDLLRPKMAVGAFDAVRKLELDMRVRRGEADGGRDLSMRVDREAVKDPMDIRLAAAGRVEAALGGIGARDAWLLSELIYPTREYADWRRCVAYITGEITLNGQGAVVKSACANLADFYNGRKRP